MPRKKKQSAVSDQQSAVRDQSTSEYKVTPWGGQDHFSCTLCQGKFDTFNKQAMLEHLVNEHDSEKALNEMYGVQTLTPDPSPLKGEGNDEEKES